MNIIKFISFKQNHSKRIIVLLLFMTIFCNSVFAIPNLDVNTNSDIWENFWDLPLIEGLLLFGNSLLGFRYVVQKLAIFFFFLNLVWHSFKLWFGTVEIKKVVIDILYKYIMVIVLLSAYPKIVDGVVSVASELGMKPTGTVEYMTNEIVGVYISSFEAASKGLMIIKQNIQAGNFNALEAKDLEKIGRAFNMSDEELDAAFKEAMPDYYVSYNEQKTDLGQLGVIQGKKVNFGQTRKERKAYKNMIKNAISKYDAKNMMIMFQAFAEAFGMKDIGAETVKTLLNSDKKSTDDFDVELQENENTIKSNIKSYFNSPFIKIPYKKKSNINEIVENKKFNYFIQGKDFYITEEFQTQILSPGQMLRIAIMEAKIVRNKGNLDMENNKDSKTGKDAEVSFVNKSLNFGKILISEIISAIVRIILPYLMVIPIIVCVINYCVCILEYYLVTSIGILFVPLLFFDPTKQFASKLLNLFFSYFMKIMTITIVNFYCMALILKSGNYIMLNANSFDFSIVIYAIFMFMLTMVFSQHAPEIGQILLTGSPALSAGSVANIGRQMGHAMHMGMHAANNVKRAAGTVGKMAAGGAVSGAQNVATLLQRRAAVAAQGEELRKDLMNNGYTKKEAGREVSAFKHQTNAQMFREDMAAKLKTKMGYTANKKGTENPVGGIGMKDGDGNKIGLTDNKKAMQERAKNAREIAQKGLDNTEGKA